MIEPDSLIDNPEPQDLGQLEMSNLRSAREQLQEVEYGYSYARRVVQGRLDTVLGVLEHKNQGDQGSDPILEMPETLGNRIKGPGLPRPTRGLEPPEWADDLLTELNDAVSLEDLSNLADMDTDVLADLAETISGIERQLSETRSGLHMRIERVQAELISRYRQGAGVEDLLT